MTRKSLWKLIGILFELWIIYAIGSAVLSLLLGWLPFGIGSFLAPWIMFALCAVVFWNQIKPQKVIPDPKKNPPLPKQDESASPDLFQEQLDKMNMQEKRMKKRVAMLDEDLRKSFGDGSVTLLRFQRPIQESVAIFERNVERLRDRIRVFDEEGYNYSRSHGDAKASDYFSRQIRKMNDILDENEKILFTLSELNTSIQDVSHPGSRQESALNDLHDLIEEAGDYQDISD